MLELHAIIVVDGPPRHLGRIGVGAPDLPLCGGGGAFLVLEVSLEGRCHEDDCGYLDGLGARLVEES